MFHLALHLSSDYGGLLIAVPPGCWPSSRDADPAQLAERLLHLARRINPKAVAISKRGPKATKPKKLRRRTDRP